VHSCEGEGLVREACGCTRQAASVQVASGYNMTDAMRERINRPLPPPMLPHNYESLADRCFIGPSFTSKVGRVTTPRRCVDAHAGCGRTFGRPFVLEWMYRFSCGSACPGASGSAARGRVACELGAALRPLAVSRPSQLMEKKGFEWVNEGKSDKLPKWGYVADAPGAEIKLKVSTNTTALRRTDVRAGKVPPQARLLCMAARWRCWDPLQHACRRVGSAGRVAASWRRARAWRSR
jgi:hypothetical protein